MPGPLPAGRPYHREATAHVVHRFSRPVGLVAARRHPASDARDHHRRDGLPAPLLGAPRTGTASGAQALLPLLAVADHGDEHPRVDGHPSQAPRQVRNPRRSPQPRAQRVADGAAQGRRAVHGGSEERGNAAHLWQELPGRLDRAHPLHALSQRGHRADAGARSIAVRRHRSERLGRADALDSAVGRRRGQRPGPRAGLSQLRVPRRGHQPGALGHPDRR